MTVSPRLLPLLLLFALSAGLPFSVRAQQNGPISIDKIEADLVDTPAYSVSTGPVTGAPQKGGKWLQVDFSYSVDADRQMLNEVQFRIYVEVQDLASPDDKDGLPAVLTGETTVTCVPNSKETHGTFFVHPFVLNRFGGERAAADYKQAKGKNIRIEAYVDGQQVAVKDKHDDDANWVGPMKKISGLVEARDQSPWAVINVDKFPPVKLRSGGSQ